ncbi:hypothetical protein [Thermogemmatispora aurantia]|nr:hypothetical protein [Thermogemmatispora aurantia]
MEERRSRRVIQDPGVSQRAAQLAGGPPGRELRVRGELTRSRC